MIDPEIRTFLAAWDAAWATLPAGSSPAQRRTHFERVAEAMRTPMPAGVTTRVHTLSCGARTVRVREFRPAAAGPLPALVYLHGGAFMQGSPETHWDITADLAARWGLMAFSVDYALAPEHPFPAAVDDVRTAVEWLFAQAGTLAVDPGRIGIGGDSAGANLAAAMTLACRGTACALRAQLLVYPCCDFDMDRPSYRENAEGPLITTASMPAVNAMYCPNPADRLNPLAAPLLAESHAGLPPAFIAVAEHDPLRDSGLAYAEALQAAGVPLVLDRGAGLIHGYLRARSYCAKSREAFTRMGDWLAARLR
ncbi:MAG: alpha/beta hydrolase [Rubrivivax sp.]|nr:alpha/beta hydrolase [Rubrivivax sp.]